MKIPSILLAVCLVGKILYAQEFSPRYVLVKLGSEVNTHFHEAAPVLSNDAKKLYFFVHNHPENTYGTEGSDDIWMSTKDDKGNWGQAVHLHAPFNNHRSNQVFTVLPDGSLLIRGGRAKNSMGFTLLSPSGQETELKVNGLADMNKGRFYGASISTDTKHLIIYMSPWAQSIRSQLYISHRLSDGSYSRPKLMAFSAKDDDFGPYLGPNDEYLYFASDRNAPGKQGGADIYKTKRLDDTWEKWSTPANLGPVINTRASDAYFCIDNDNNVFVSRANSTIDGGNLDLFELAAREIRVFIAGNVYDEKTSQSVSAEIDVRPVDNSPLAARTDTEGKFEMRVPEVDSYALTASAKAYTPAHITLSLPPIQSDTTLNVSIPLSKVERTLVLEGSVFDKKTGASVNAKVDIRLPGDERIDPQAEAVNGRYEREINEPGLYHLTAHAAGYLDGADSVMVGDMTAGHVRKDIYLQPIEVGVTVRLNDIYFDFDKTTLKPESFTELDKVVTFLENNPNLEIEIAGHTDSMGADEYNLFLSQGRAQAVVDYIIGKGVDSQRLIAKGYGETKPVESNDREAGRAVNRRVEFTVLKM